MSSYGANTRTPGQQKQPVISEEQHGHRATLLSTDGGFREEDEEQEDDEDQGPSSHPIG